MTNENCESNPRRCGDCGYSATKEGDCKDGIHFPDNRVRVCWRQSYEVEPLTMCQPKTDRSCDA